MVLSRMGVHTQRVGQIRKREGQANVSVHNSFKALSEALTTRGAADVSQQERKQDLKTKSVQHRREHTYTCTAIEPEGAKAVKQDEEWSQIAEMEHRDEELGRRRVEDPRESHSAEQRGRRA